MTTLESKLRALVAELKPLLEKATARPWNESGRDELGRDLLWYSADRLLAIRAVNTVSQLEALLAERQEPLPSDGRCSYIFEHTGNRCQLPSGHVKDGHQWRLSEEPAAAPSSGTGERK